MRNPYQYLPIKFLLPGLLLSLAVIFSATTYFTERSTTRGLSAKVTETFLRREVAQIADQTERLLKLNPELLHGLTFNLATSRTLNHGLIIGSHGKILSATDLSLIGENIELLGPALQEKVKLAQGQRRVHIQRDGAQIYGAMSFHMPETSLVPQHLHGAIYIELDLSRVYKRAEAAAQRRTLPRIFVGLLLALFCYLFLYRYLSKSLQELSLAAQHFSHDQKSLRIPEQGAPEVLQLAQDFKHMTEQLAQNFRALSNTEQQAQQLNQQLKALLQALPDPLFELDRDGRYLQVFSHSEKELVISSDALMGKKVHELLPLAAADTIMHTINRALQYNHSTGAEIVLEVDGSQRWFELSAARKAPATQNLEATVILVSRDVTQRKLAEFSEQNRNQVLGLLARGASLKTIFEKIIQDFETQHPPSLCSLLLLDQNGRHLIEGVAPSLPESYNQAIDKLEVGVGVGSCGTAAATGKRVIVEDIQNHPHWKPYKSLAAEADLGSCWSEPILNNNNKVLGTFAIYHPQPSKPSQAQIEQIEQVAHLASIVIERTRYRQASELAALVYRHTSEAMMVTDENSCILAINPAFTDTTGYREDEVLGQTPKLLSSGRQGADFYESMWRELNNNGSWQGEIWNRRKNGEEYAEWLTINTIFDKNNQVYRRVALFADITEKKEAEALIWSQANYDHLTQLPNRRLFNDRLQQELSKARRQEQRVGLLFIDLDRFKEVNDSLGHAMGDQLLIETASRIKGCLRESDTVARLGGDEFTVTLPNLTELGHIERIALSINQALSKPFTLGSDEAYISASIGITAFPDDAQSSEELLKHADQAMYAAKNEGRNRFCYFTPGMQAAAHQRLGIIRELYQAVAEQQLEVYFQPILNIKSRTFDKAEALLRWQHPEKGFISPAEFIPVAEDTGLIHEIGDWVLSQSLQQVETLITRGHRDFQISVNMSPLQFQSLDENTGSYQSLLSGHHAYAKHIVIEITEGVLLNAESAITEKLERFHRAGVELSIDDFGTGYSSLSYLKKLDTDYLKIDQTFVRNLATDSSDQALSEAITMMSHKLGLKVIAEGVETEEQQVILEAMGCDYAQGYLHARPMPAAELMDFLDAFVKRDKT